MNSDEFLSFRSSNGQKVFGPSSLTGERPDLEMTRHFGPVETTSAAVVIEQQGPYRNSPQKVFPFRCFKKYPFIDSFDSFDDFRLVREALLSGFDVLTSGADICCTLRFKGDSFVPQNGKFRDFSVFQCFPVLSFWRKPRPNQAQF